MPSCHLCVRAYAASAVSLIGGTQPDAIPGGPGQAGEARTIRGRRILMSMLSIIPFSCVCTAATFASDMAVHSLKSAPSAQRLSSAAAGMAGSTAQALLAELEDLRRVLDSPYAATSPSRLSARLRGSLATRLPSRSVAERYTSHGGIYLSASLTPPTHHDDPWVWKRVGAGHRIRWRAHRTALYRCCKG